MKGLSDDPNFGKGALCCSGLIIYGHLNRYLLRELDGYETVLKSI